MCKEGHPRRIPGERSVTDELFPERISESHVCPRGTRYAEGTAADAAVRSCADGTEDHDELHVDGATRSPCTGQALTVGFSTCALELPRAAASSSSTSKR